MQDRKTHTHTHTHTDKHKQKTQKNSIYKCKHHIYRHDRNRKPLTHILTENTDNCSRIIWPKITPQTYRKAVQSPTPQCPFGQPRLSALTGQQEASRLICRSWSVNQCEGYEEGYMIVKVRFTAMTPGRDRIV